MRSVHVSIPRLLLFLLAGCAASPSISSPDSGPEIRPERIAAHVAVLAGDAYEGRAPGTPGETKTVAYIDEAFRRAGLSAFAGNDYRLPVPLVRSEAVAGRVSVGNIAIDNSAASFVRAPGVNGKVEAGGDAVFAGYGVRAGAEGRDDFAGVDFNGKIAVILAGLPPGSDDAPAVIRDQWGRIAKLRNAANAGARAAIIIYDAAAEDETWRAVRGVVTRVVTRLGVPSDEAAALTAVMDRAGGMQLAAAFGTDLSALKAEAERAGFRARRLGPVALAAENRLTDYTSANVAGVLRGNRYPDEYVIYLAHWDHLGRCAATGDTICNGAVDNASGVGGLIELAAAFSGGGQPARSVVFLATTAEESGLLGGKHFVTAGPIPVNRMVAAFGLDTIAANGPTRDVILLGKGQSSLDAWIKRSARASGRRIADLPGVQSFFSRSDHYAFAEAGVPAVIATGVFAAGGRFQDYMRDHYHKPSDEVSAAIDYRGAADDVTLILDAGRALANSRDWPKWMKSSPYRRPAPSLP